MVQKHALGRGLGALIDIEPVSTGGSSSINEIEISKIHPNPHQPRTFFDEEALAEFTGSILFGIVVGTFSSTYVAAALLLYLPKPAGSIEEKPEAV